MLTFTKSLRDRFAVFGFTKSLRGRLAAYFALAIAVSLLISALISAVLVQSYLKHRTISELKEQALSLSSQIESEGLPDRRYIMDLERVHDTRAFILPYGGQQSLSQLPSGRRGNEAEPSLRALSFLDWELLEGGGAQVAETQIPGVEQKEMVVAHGVQVQGELAGAVVLAKPLGSLQPWVPLAGWSLVAAAVSLIASIVMAFLLARRLSRPLHEITQAASAVAEGDFSHEVTVRSEDEIGRLADAFRYMSAKVQEYQEQQRDFVINVSHELKTPLTSIAGHAQALREGVASDPADVTRSLDVINSDTRRLSRLIEDLLSVAKFDARQFDLRTVTVPLGETLEELANGFARQAEERRVTLSVGATPGMKITTDPDRLRQILSNLVQNALHHTPAGGLINVKAQAGGHSRVSIAVSDTGRGVAPEVLPHVFDRFYRAGSGSREAGLGLGLAISRELARALGGDITVSSRPGQGSTFTVTLPA